MMHRIASILVLVGLWAAPLAATPAGAGEPKRVAVATLVTETGTVMAHEAAGKSWQPVKQKDKLYAGDLLIGFPQAKIDAINGSARINFIPDLDGDSPYPIAESAVMLREPKDADFEFTLDRGRVDVENRKQNGATAVRVQVRNQNFDLTLAEPGASVALELYGRWAAGVHFNNDPKAKEAPTATLVILVRKGSVSIKHGAYVYGMSAPPGPALIEWDSTTGLDSAPRRLEKLPPWAGETPETPAGKAKAAVLNRFRKTIVEKSLPAALDEFVNSQLPGERILAVRAMGAFDDLSRLAAALREAKHLEVWDAGVLALRHWIGRGPGQDQALFKGMMESGQFNPIEAETIMQLLHSYGDADLSRPETYETLIAYLNHDKLAIRGLAHWHLIRLVSSGKDTGYNPMDSKEKRSAAVEKWRKLVPRGTVPPRPRPMQPK